MTLGPLFDCGATQPCPPPTGVEGKGMSNGTSLRLIIEDQLPL